MRQRLQAWCLLAPALALPGCSTISSVKSAVLGGSSATPKVISGFIGGVAADEPRAAIAARDVLATGGNAADAAVAAGFMLSVTLPSRASLGSSGACLAYMPGQPSPEAILFTATPGGPGGDRPAAIPMMARGLCLLNARYGTRTITSLIAPAQTAANQGVATSHALASDLSQVAAPLLEDPDASQLFAPQGHPLAEGDTLIQPDLAAMLGQISQFGVSDLYTGPLATSLITAVQSAGGGTLTLAMLRDALPATAEPISVTQGDDDVSFLPGDGGMAAAEDFSSGQTALNVPALPASTSFVVVDNKGGAVGCSFSMNNLFGTGRIAPGTGILLGASPSNKPSPLISVAIAWSPRLNAFRAITATTGQAAAPSATATVIKAALAGISTPTIPDPGRYNLAVCDQYLPGNNKSCHFTADPNGAGLAAVSD